MRDGPGLRFYSAEQVRGLDRAAVEAGIPAYELMQRAAASAWRELTRRWPKARRLAVVCGPGNNGGDGYEMARLAKGAGLTVEVFQVGEVPAKGPAAQAAKAWRAAGGKAQPLRGELPGVDVVVDALFGIGLDRAPEGAARSAILAIDAARDRGAGVLAVDVPSGLDSDRGRAPGDVVHADLTVTFIGRKPGLHTGIGPDCVGAVVFDDLQVPEVAYRSKAACADVLGPAWLAGALPRRARTTHKGDNGHVLIVGGDEGMAGAALMAGRAALRAGAGWVSVATRAAHAVALTAAQPELMCHAFEDARGLKRLLERATVLVVGPGLGRGDWGRELWAQALTAPQPLVVDADGLNWLSENAARRDDWILTPHPGEAGRLLGVASAEVQADRFAAARMLRERYGGVVVLKGAGTIVQGAATGLCPHGNPGMAVGGMGDILSGIIAGLLAQAFGAETAARAGVAAHALAGDAAASRGERGLLPTDLLAALPPLLNP